MKAEYTSPQFTPKTIAVTFESQRELDQFAALFNFTPIADSVEFDCNALTEAACRAGGSINAEFAKLVTAIKAHPSSQR